MITSAECIKKYGDPRKDTLAWEQKWMTVYDVPEHIEKLNSFIPRKIYCHKDFAPVLAAWLEELASSELIQEIKTYDGCFNIRKMRGLNTLSIHAFGLAIDFNASHNPLQVTYEQALKKGLAPFSEKFIEVSRKYFSCGWDFKTRPDGMHYQLKEII